MFFSFKIGAGLGVLFFIWGIWQGAAERNQSNKRYNQMRDYEKNQQPLAEKPYWKQRAEAKIDYDKRNGFFDTDDETKKVLKGLVDDFKINQKIDRVKDAQRRAKESRRDIVGTQWDNVLENEITKNIIKNENQNHTESITDEDFEEIIHKIQTMK
jgi:hypothetical protein